MPQKPVSFHRRRLGLCRTRLPRPRPACNIRPVKPLNSIRILRALAALGVLLFHACQWSGADFAVGAAGVDLFFLVSGFVLWLAVDRAPASAARFLWARASRIAPLYWLWTLIAAGLAWRWPSMIPVVHLDLIHL